MAGKVNSRQKGARGERELAHELTRLGLGECRRGVQYQGGPDSPDVIGVPGLHIECKRVERLQLSDAMAQSVRDAGPEEVPVVMHRKSREGWLVTMKLSDFCAMYQKKR